MQNNIIFSLLLLRCGMCMNGWNLAVTINIFFHGIIESFSYFFYFYCCRPREAFDTTGGHGELFFWGGWWDGLRTWLSENGIKELKEFRFIFGWRRKCKFMDLKAHQGIHYSVFLISKEFFGMEFFLIRNRNGMFW